MGGAGVGGNEATGPEAKLAGVGVDDGAGIGTRDLIGLGVGEIIGIGGASAPVGPTATGLYPVSITFIPALFKEMLAYSKLPPPEPLAKVICGELRALSSCVE
ncbi:hypothetical protein GOP47_0021995 [Adiantum capillus-veneris]|uniref:Uncharacterized protein n=1 Tax=Adiantum capillus-veneris TaxID=13818 RepID=A0A9D4U8J3_ADICA|nr:hypothetical protein GOP47_0021995 [Adiantum capillus-veneris]